MRKLTLLAVATFVIASSSAFSCDKQSTQSGCEGTSGCRWAPAECESKGRGEANPCLRVGKVECETGGAVENILTPIFCSWDTSGAKAKCSKTKSCGDLDEAKCGKAKSMCISKPAKCVAKTQQ